MNADRGANRFIVALVVTLGAACPAFSATLHVAPDGSGDYPTIQAAIDAAASGDEIVLSDGTFTGEGNWDLNFGTKELVLHSEHGYQATVIDCGFDGSNGVSHSGLTVSGGQTRATRIEGIALCHAWGDMHGGAIACLGTSPVIRSVHVHNNRIFRQGGAFFIQGGSPVIEECVLEYLFSSGSGAAVYARQTKASLRQCVIQGNEGSWGTLDLDGGSVSGCTFRGNRGHSDSGPGNDLRVAGGHVTVEGCQFLGQPVTAISLDSAGDVLVRNSLFEDNQSDTGACLFGSGSAKVYNSTFRRSWAWIGGGAIWFSGSLFLDHCVFDSNTSQTEGTVCLAGGDLTVSHCTFARNETGAGGSAIVLDSRFGPVGRVALDYTILAFGAPFGSGSPSGAFECIGTPATLEVSCTDIFGNYGGDWLGCVAGMNGTSGNLSADPRFCGVASGDFSLEADSPCASGTCGLIGALGIGCGATALAERSWGSIKALYR